MSWHFSLTLKDAYSLPRIDETVDALSGSKYFSVMDIDRAFWQVGLKESDKHCRWNCAYGTYFLGPGEMRF